MTQSDADVLQAIQDRNRRVELDKAWEVSLTRRSFIALMTYAVACYYFWVIGVTEFWLHAAVPTGGYVFSTLSLPWLKQLWVRLR